MKIQKAELENLNFSKRHGLRTKRRKSHRITLCGKKRRNLSKEALGQFL